MGSRMTSKGKTLFFCTDCGGESTTWKGQCPHCGAWNTMQEQPVAPKASANKGAQRANTWTGRRTAMMDLAQVPVAQEARRYTSGIGEFDRVLGGGLVGGGVVLIGGDPGIGKSTLLLQTMASARSVPRLYVTGEESAGQVADRAARLHLDVAGVGILAETHLETIVENARIKFPNGAGLLVVDSIQTMYSDDVPSAPGTVTQVRECAARLTRLAKESGVTVILIGHVTKDGSLAGPRVLEHLVDTVLYFEGDPQSPHRIIRAFKNRFGAAQEIGAFEMTEDGLMSIDNPSAMFLTTDRHHATGSCVFVYQEGPRPLLLDIQALMDDAQGSSPRRLGVGVDGNRLAMLLAVLHKHGSFQTGDQDVFVNVVGGIRVQETAADLPVLLAVLSSFRDRALPDKTVAFGEVGLSGEVRPVPNGEERLKEAAHHGFRRAIVPAANAPKRTARLGELEILGVETLREAIEAVQ